MGKIVAIGGGRYSDDEIINIFEKIVSLADKRNPKVLFLPTAGYDDINGDEDIQRSFEKYGCQYDILYLTDEKRTVDDIRSVILDADIVYVGGGDVRFMMETWRKTGADKALIEAYNSGKIMSEMTDEERNTYTVTTRAYDKLKEQYRIRYETCLD